MPGGDRLGQVPALVLQIGSEAVLDDPGVASFASILSEYRKLGHRTSPTALLPGVISQARVLMNLARHAATPMRAQLLDLAGQYAEYAGWLAQEAGDDRAALWWTDLAVELAHQAGNRDMASHALIRKALVSMYRDDGRRTADLAAQAQQDTAASPRIRGLAAQREAQGLALLGEDASCRSALDRAEDLLAAHTPDWAGSPLGPTSIPDPGPIAVGWCLLDLGRPAQAAEVLGSAIAAIPADASRSRARYGARQALAYSMAHEVDHACAVAREVLVLAGSVDSATIRIELRSLRRSLSRWPAHQRVREIMPSLADALSRGGLPSAT
jgi:tetratricopeptide (TPR) repeat protein